MRSTEVFDRYLERFRERLKKLLLARGAAMLALAALAITVLAVAAAIRNGFPDDIVITARLTLVAVLGVLAWRFVWLPRRRADANGIGAEIEGRSAAFGGRVETYLQTDDAALAGQRGPLARRAPPDAQ